MPPGFERALTGVFFPHLDVESLTYEVNNSPPSHFEVKNDRTFTSPSLNLRGVEKDNVTFCVCFFTRSKHVFPLKIFVGIPLISEKVNLVVATFFLNSFTSFYVE